MTFLIVLELLLFLMALTVLDILLNVPIKNLSPSFLFSSTLCSSQNEDTRWSTSTFGIFEESERDMVEGRIRRQCVRELCVNSDIVTILVLQVYEIINFHRKKREKIKSFPQFLSFKRLKLRFFAYILVSIY